MLKSCQHGMTDTSRPRSLSLLLGLRQLQGLLLRQRSHCQVPGTSALRWAFHRLKRKSRFPSRLPMRHVSRASMASTIKSEWHNAGTLEDSASNASSQGPSFVGYGSQSPEPEFTGAGACLVESAFGFEAPNEEKIEEAQEITVNWSELAHSNGLVSTQAPTSQRSSSSMQVSELVGGPWENVSALMVMSKQPVLCADQAVLAYESTWRFVDGSDFSEERGWISMDQCFFAQLWMFDIIGSSQVAAILYALTALKVMNALPLPGQKPKEAKELLNWRFRKGGAISAFSHTAQSAELRDGSQWNTRELVLTHLSPCYQRSWLRLFDSLVVDPYNEHLTEGMDEPFRLEHGQGVFDFYRDPRNQEAAQLGGQIGRAILLQIESMANLRRFDVWFQRSRVKSTMEKVQLNWPLWKELCSQRTPEVVDLGGGQGILLAALCKRYGFRGLVVDRTGREMIALTKATFESEQRSMGFFNDPMTDDRGCKMETSSSLGLQKTFQSMPRCEMILKNLHETVAMSSSSWPRLLVLEQVLPEASDTSEAAELARAELDDAGLMLDQWGGRHRDVSWMPAQAAPMGTMASAVGTRAKYTEAPLAIGMGTRSNFAEAAPMGTMASAVGTRANYTEAPLAIGMGTRSNFAEAAPMGTMASAAVPLETTAGSQANYEVAPMRTMAACVGTDMQAMDFGIGCQVQMDAEVFAPALGTLGQAQMARPINQGATVDIVCCSTEGQVSVPVPAVRSSYSAPVRASVSSTVSPPRAFAKDLHPEAFHSAEEIDTIVRRIIQEVLGDAKVSHRPELSDLWCDQILERVLKEVSSLGRPFKYMATCVISKQPGSLDTARQWAEEKTTRARRTKIDGRPPKEGGVEGAVSPTPTATIVTVSLDPDLDLAAPETRADEEDLVVAMARAKVVEKVELEVTFQPPDLGALQEMAPLPTTTFIICLLIERKREWFGILLRQTRSETCCEIKALKSLKGKDAGNTRTDGKVLGPMRMPRSGRWRRKIEVHDFGPAISSPAYFSALEDLSGRTWTNGLLLLPFGIRSMIVCVAAVWAMVAWTALSLSTPAGVSDQFRLRPTAVEL
eukprot:symbB.v1.2.017732.t3/scaffold1366.1/size123243/8